MTGASAPLAIVTEVLSLKTIVHPSSVSTTLRDRLVLLQRIDDRPQRRDLLVERRQFVPDPVDFRPKVVVVIRTAPRRHAEHGEHQKCNQFSHSFRFLSLTYPIKKSAASSWQDTAENSKRTFAHLRNFAFRDRNGPDGRGKIAVLILARNPAGNKSSVKCERQVF